MLDPKGLEKCLSDDVKPVGVKLDVVDGGLGIAVVYDFNVDAFNEGLNLSNMPMVDEKGRSVL